MKVQIHLKDNWSIMQDVHHAGEKLGIYSPEYCVTQMGPQISEWEPLPELKHLQLMLADQPYFGRELRYFNQAPWWYRTEFDWPENLEESAMEEAYLTFTNVDYYCKIWLNGKYVGSHEGYSAAFSLEVSEMLTQQGRNILMVEVWSGWDEAVEQDKEDMRTILVQRHMVKGTYEHSDTFIQRDVNPVGIYGTVCLTICAKERIALAELSYQLDETQTSAHIQASVQCKGLVPGDEYHIRIHILDQESGEEAGGICHTLRALKERSQEEFSADIEGIHLWNTWDHGGAWMYQAVVELIKEDSCLDQWSQDLAFRSIAWNRDSKRTQLLLNQKRFYVRGTSYFPDNYISAMDQERYRRDLILIKAAGFNTVRVHVHVEQQVFYTLCDQMGIAVIQDSEYNWTHPATDEWAEKFVHIYEENIRMLKQHPSILCWIGMNEPGCADPDGKTRERFMQENPGPRLYREIQEIDPSRPIIKGSFCEEDPLSGDSHNYLGSLSGGEYGDIYGTTEKLNTEYGFDAPSILSRYRAIPKLYQRLEPLGSAVMQIQDYQYRLLKYYTEHYRIQKYRPCSGYVQFMFIDLAPQSFYGLYDWWGMPKKGLDAILESNQPLGIFAKYKEHFDGIYVVNDTEQSYTDCVADWLIRRRNSKDIYSNEIMERGSVTLNLETDSIEEIPIPESIRSYFKPEWDLDLILRDSKGNKLSSNHYKDLFYFPMPIKGHPERMSHELGMRLYWA